MVNDNESREHFTNFYFFFSIQNKTKQNEKMGQKLKRNGHFHEFAGV